MPDRSVTPSPSPDALATLPGVDASVGRASTMGNDQLYRRLLKMFLEGQHDVVAKFSRARALGDVGAATRLVHNLRTIAASLGMLALADSCRLLEAACLEGGTDERMQPLLQQVEHELMPILAGLRAMAAAEGA